MLNFLGNRAGLRGAKIALGTLLTAGVVGFLPGVAHADRGHGNWDRGDHDRRNWSYRDRDDHGGGRLDIRLGGPVYAPAPVIVAPPVQRVWVEPVYRAVTEQVWVPDQYQTVIDHVWIDPVTQTVTDRVWVPDQFAWSDVDHVDANGRHYTTKEKVLAQPGHFENQPRQVVVTPGHYQDVPRQQLVAAAHYESVTHQELVSAGYWQDQPAVIVAPRPVYRSGFGINLRIPLGR
jgi:hypothetical protein